MGNRRQPKNPQVAVGYLRVSREEQSLGPEAQRAAIETWASHRGVTVAAWFEDHGVCGATELVDRPGLVAALAALGVHRAGVLAVAKRDRLARDVVIAAMIDRAVARCGASVVAANGAGNGDSPEDGFMRTILDGAAQYERALIRGRTKAARRALRVKGQRAGCVPFGFTADAEGHLSPCEAEQTAIARARELRAGGTSLWGIVAELSRAGMTSRAGTPFGLTQVVRMLSAPG